MKKRMVIYNLTIQRYYVGLGKFDKFDNYSSTVDKCFTSFSWDAFEFSNKETALEYLGIFIEAVKDSQSPQFRLHNFEIKTIYSYE